MKKIFVGALAALAMVFGGAVPAALGLAPTNVVASSTFNSGNYGLNLAVSFNGNAAVSGNGDYSIAVAEVNGGTVGSFSDLETVYNVVGAQAVSRSLFLNSSWFGKTVRVRVTYDQSSQYHSNTLTTPTDAFAYSSDLNLYSPPNNPTVSATAGSNAGEISVSWNNVAGLSYEISYGSTAQPGGFPPTYSAWAATSGNPQTFTNLPALQVTSTLYYTFRVRATDSSSVTAIGYSSQVTPPVSVGAVTNLSVSNQYAQSGGLDVSWTGATNATGYIVSYSTSASGPWTSAGTPMYANYSISGLNTGSSYYIKVEPTRSGTTYAGAVSSSATLPSTGPQALGAPTNLILTSPSSGQIMVSWTAVNGAVDYQVFVGASPSGSWTPVGNSYSNVKVLTNYNPSSSWYVKVVARDMQLNSGSPTISSSPITPNGQTVNSGSQTTTTTILPQVPVFKQPKFSMPSKIDVDTTGKVSLSGKDMGVNSVLIGGKEQKIDTNSDEKLVFDTTGLAKGVHDLVMKGAFGTYTIQKAIQVGEAVVTKVAAVSARQVGMAGGELSISGVGLEGTTQITMNGQVLEIISKTDSKVTFKVPASTVASVNSIMIEGSFVPVLFKNAFSYTK